MKLVVEILVLSLVFMISIQAQEKKKINVSEDTFIEGGSSSSTAMGEKHPKNMRIFNSNDESKYARIGYMKFSIPKKIKEINTVELHFPLKVYKTDKNPNGKFGLEVYAVENDNWNEKTITWDEALELGSLLGEIKVSQSLDGKNKKIKITLEVEEFKKMLKGKKDRKVTLALTNQDFNKVSAMAPTKEQSGKSAAYLIIK